MEGSKSINSGWIIFAVGGLILASVLASGLSGTNPEAAQPDTMLVTAEAVDAAEVLNLAGELRAESLSAAKTRVLATASGYAAETAELKEMAAALAAASAASKPVMAPVQAAPAVYTGTSLSSINATTTANLRGAAGGGLKKAWVYIPDTTINRVVLQSGDNAFYLRHNVYGGYDQHGCLIFDATANIAGRGGISQNAVIYGHSFMDRYWNMNSANHRLEHLNKFRPDIDGNAYRFAANHPYVYLTVGESTLVYQIFAVSIVSKNQKYNTSSISDSMISYVRDRSFWDYGVTASSSDKLLTFSACTYNNFGVSYGYPNNLRLVVMAKLLPEDAALSNTVSISANTDRKGL